MKLIFVARNAACVLHLFALSRVMKTSGFPHARYRAVELFHELTRTVRARHTDDDAIRHHRPVTAIPLEGLGYSPLRSGSSRSRFLSTSAISSSHSFTGSDGYGGLVHKHEIFVCIFSYRFSHFCRQRGDPL